VAFLRNDRSALARIKIEYRFSRSIQLIDPSRGAPGSTGCARMGLGRWLTRKICTIRTRYFSPDYRGALYRCRGSYLRTPYAIESVIRGSDRPRLSHVVTQRYGLFRLLESGHERTYAHRHSRMQREKKNISLTLKLPMINLYLFFYHLNICIFWKNNEERKWIERFNYIHVATNGEQKIFLLFKYYIYRYLYNKRRGKLIDRIFNY